MIEVLLNKIKSVGLNVFPVALVLFFMSFGAGSLQATHIVGGNISYKCLGFTNYEITLTVRRDCDLGDPEAQFDDPVSIGIFDQYGNLLPWYGVGGQLLIPFSADDTLDSEFAGECDILGTPVCVHTTTYTGIVTLPYRKGGYTLAYQRCCRNASLTNIVDPLNTGGTYYLRLTEQGINNCNTQAVFNEWPEIYACSNNELEIDQSAFDPDGDSLVYKLCTPSLGATIDEPMPQPPGNPNWPVPPYYDEITWAAGFSEDNMTGSTDPLVINPVTGMITGTPGMVGQYLIGVCVEEYRDGQLMSFTRRDFELNTRVCAEGPTADFTADSLTCDGLTIEFTNTSIDADEYEWYFDYPNEDPAFFSTEENPIFTYPEGGFYDVKLKVFRLPDGCMDMITKTIGVFNSELEADFTADVLECYADSSLLELIATANDPNPDYDPESYDWLITGPGFSLTLSGDSVQAVVPKIDDLQVTLIVTSGNGCSVEVTKTIDTDPVELDFEETPMMVCEGDTMQILSDPNSSWTYTWEPLDGLIFEDSATMYNPSVIGDTNIVYYVTVTDGICSKNDSISILVDTLVTLELVGDTISCDGFAHLEILGGNSMNQFIWSNNPDFNPTIGDMSNTLNDPIEADGYETYYVMIKPGTGCSDIYSITVANHQILLDYEAEITVCEGSVDTIVVSNLVDTQTVEIIWDANDYIISDLEGDTVIIDVPEDGANTTLTFTATNQYGCTLNGSIDIIVEQKPELMFTDSLVCGSYQVCFENTTDPLEDDVIWDFGDETTESDTSSLQNPCYTYPGPGTYTVTMTTTSGVCAGTEVSNDVLVTEILEITTDNDVLFCAGDSVHLSIELNVPFDDVTVSWCNTDGDSLGTGPELDILPNSDTTIIVKVIDEAGCEEMETIVLDQYGFNITIDVPEIACEFEEVQIIITDLNGDNLSYLWTPEDCIVGSNTVSNPTVFSEDTKDFTGVITNLDNGCDTTIIVTLNISEIDIQATADPDTVYQCHPSEISVEFDPDWSYEWSNGKDTDVFEDTLLNETTYTVTVTDENGCTDTSSVTVAVILPECDETDVYLPNAFSPNGDKVNDEFIVRSNFVKKMELVIYDRWGKKMFTSTEQSIGWDGTYEGSEAAPDVYAYSLYVVCSNGEEYKTSGNVTLLR